MAQFDTVCKLHLHDLDISFKEYRNAQNLIKHAQKWRNSGVSSDYSELCENITEMQKEILHLNIETMYKNGVCLN